jgi:CubicO group peptidase (beta-lactamase class C family)
MSPFMRLRFALQLAAALVIASGTVEAQNGDRRTQRVDSIFARWDKPGSPGAAVVVVRDGRIVFEKGYGYASLEHNIPITPATVFDLASVSKQFTGLAIAMLVDQGRIKLDDDIRKHIPELQDFGQRVTIDHLVHHTSGIRDWPGTLGIAGWRMDDVISYDQILRFAYKQKTLNFVPGAEYTYSNTGYNLLAEIVARVGKKSFRAWTDENLFRPLGMTNTHFHDNHTMVVANRAFGYGRSDTSFTAISNNLTALGSSSLYSSARDLAKWVANFDDAKVGGRSSMDLMRSYGRLNSGAQNAYAFGMSHGLLFDVPTLSHSGGWAGFGTFVLYLPQQRLSVIVLANTGINTGVAANTIAGIFLDRSLPSNRPAMADAPDVSVPNATLDRYVGTYKLGPAWYVAIRRDGSQLVARATGEPDARLSARGPTSFWVAGYNAPMGFGEDSATHQVEMLYRGRRIARLPARDHGEGRATSDLAGEYVSDELGTSYTVIVKDATVSLRHWRHGDIPLARAWGEDYYATQFFMRSVEFQRDATGKVTGLLVTAGERVRDVRFVRK